MSKVRKQVVTTISTYQLLRPEDRVLVAVSGGKDSSVLLQLLVDIQKKAPFSFELEAALLDQKQPGFQIQKFQSWVHDLGVPFHVIEKDTYSIVKEKSKTGQIYCTICSRLRRGILYNFAFENKFSKIALGHHREDANQTLLLNLFYTGKLASMPPKLLSDDRRNWVIRPLIQTAEKDIEQISQLLQIPTIPCSLCGSQENLKRKRMKSIISELEKEIPQISNSMISAMSNVRSSHLLDSKIWDYNCPS